MGSWNGPRLLETRFMWPKQNSSRDLRALSGRISAALRIDPDLVACVLQHACPRLGMLLGPNAKFDRLLYAEAWVELGLWLIAWELPDWSIHGLTRDDARWCCSIGVSGIAVNWVEDVVEFHHDSLELAVFGAFVEAQLRKSDGPTPSNITAFRRLDFPPAPPTPVNLHRKDR